MDEFDLNSIMKTFLSSLNDYLLMQKRREMNEYRVDYAVSESTKFLEDHGLKVIDLAQWKNIEKIILILDEMINFNQKLLSQTKYGDWNTYGYQHNHENDLLQLLKERLRIELDKRIFVIHGRNSKVSEAMFAFLTSLSLNPLKFEEIKSTTKKGTPYIGEVLDQAFSISHVIIGLFTPDDEVRLKTKFVNENDSQYEREILGQPRPNVIFEVGMAFGKNPDRTIIVEVGRIKPFSDLSGRHTVRLDNSVERRRELVELLKSIGCPVNDSIDTWKTEGDFTI